MDQKLKNYSSGMQVRLAFSIAIRARSEILLVDEVLAVGDAAFQAKCFDVFAKLKETGRTVILVTHDMNSVLRFCDKAMLINNGKVLSVDNPSKISDKYLELNYDNRENINDKESYKYIKSANLQIVDSDKNVDTISQKDSIKIIISYENKNIEKLHFGLQLFNDSGTYCFGTNTKISRRPVINKKQGRVGVELQDLNLLAGTYHFTLAVMNESATQVLEYRPKLIEFRVTKDSEYEGIIMLDHRWEAE
jgi:ABC-type glutathione transport system ATPase component